MTSTIHYNLILAYPTFYFPTNVWLEWLVLVVITQYKSGNGR